MSGGGYGDWDGDDERDNLGDDVGCWVMVLVLADGVDDADGASDGASYGDGASDDWHGVPSIPQQ